MIEHQKVVRVVVSVCMTTDETLQKLHNLTTSCMARAHRKDADHLLWCDLVNDLLLAIRNVERQQWGDVYEVIDNALDALCRNDWSWRQRAFGVRKV